MIYNFIKVKSIIRTYNDFWSENKTPFLMLSLLTEFKMCTVKDAASPGTCRIRFNLIVFGWGYLFFFSTVHISIRFYKVINADISNQLAETAWTAAVYPMIPFYLVNLEKNNVCYNYDNIHIACSQENSRCVSLF